jgi:hypothetical protein
MTSRSHVRGALRRSAVLAAGALLVAAGAGCAGLAPDGITAGGALATPPLPREVVALSASMSAEGRTVFFGARPKLLDRAQMAVECREDEVAAVLGCYADGRIFILRVTRPDLAGIMEVTAAHEMLHAVYSYLPPPDRARIDAAVEDTYRVVNGPRLQKSLAAYESLGPLDRLDELHSILGTETAAVNPVLAGHYARFFASRERVVQASDRFEAVFEALERQIDGLIAEAERLQGPIDALEVRLEADEAALDALDRRLDGLRAAGDAAGFNRLLPERNRLARTIEQGITRYDQMVDDYNAKVDQIDALALEQDKLLESLDEKGPPPGP